MLNKHKKVRNMKNISYLCMLFSKNQIFILKFFII